jgi:hypothetical protein
MDEVCGTPQHAHAAQSQGHLAQVDDARMHSDDELTGIYCQIRRGTFAKKQRRSGRRE